MMSEKSKVQKPKIEELELNRETIQELTEGQAEDAAGGIGTGQTKASCGYAPTCAAQAACIQIR